MNIEKDCVLKNESRQPQIDEQMEILRRTSEQIYVKVYDLKNKLSKIIRESPQEEAYGEPKIVESLCPLASEIRQITGVLKSTEIIIEDIFNCAEISPKQKQ